MYVSSNLRLSDWGIKRICRHTSVICSSFNLVARCWIKPTILSQNDSRTSIFDNFVATLSLSTFLIRLILVWKIASFSFNSRILCARSRKSFTLMEACLSITTEPKVKLLRITFVWICVRLPLYQPSLIKLFLNCFFIKIPINALFYFICLRWTPILKFFEAIFITCFNAI